MEKVKLSKGQSVVRGFRVAVVVDCSVGVPNS